MKRDLYIYDQRPIYMTTCSRVAMKQFSLVHETYITQKRPRDVKRDLYHSKDQYKRHVQTKTSNNFHLYMSIVLVF